MSWARFDDKRADHPKLLEAGLEARGLDEAAICWSAGQETDGLVTEAVVRMLAAGHGCAQWKRPVAKLVGVGRWEPVDGGWMIHDFLDFNPSKAERDAHRRDERERKARGRARSSDKNPLNVPLGHRAESDLQSGAPSDPSRPSPAQPGPIRPRRAQPRGDLASVKAEDAAAAAPIVDQAFELLARRHLNDSTKRVRYPNVYLAKTVGYLRAEHAERIAQIRLDDFGSANELAEFLEPRHEPKTDLQQMIATVRIEADPDNDDSSAMAAP